jgi:hypothetical protein
MKKAAEDSTKLFHGRMVVACALLAVMLAFGSAPALAQEAEEETGQPTEAAGKKSTDSLGGQSLESAANDATASMWTFQLSMEGRTWITDEGPNGQPRPEGNRDQFMLRFVAPVPLGKNLKVINRFTMRNNEAADKSSGAGDAEYFALFVPFEWSTGRWGIGPQVNFPAESSKFGSEKWRYGFATAWLERVGDKVLTGVLVQQIWGKTDASDPDRQVAQPITIQPVFNYSLKNGYYVNIGETAFSYNWDANAWLIPLGFRFGKVFINQDGSTWNLYGEIRKTVYYGDSWPGSVMDTAVRVNLSYAFPM